jgi:hypothetical protein
MAWKTEPSENVRAAFPRHYWFHKYDGRPHFMWDDIEVSEQEFRRHVVTPAIFSSVSSVVVGGATTSVRRSV